MYVCIFKNIQMHWVLLLHHFQCFLTIFSTLDMSSNWQNEDVKFVCVCSAQQSAVRDRSLMDELEETREMLKEAQERASCTQSSFVKLVYQTVSSLPEKLPSKLDISQFVFFFNPCLTEKLKKLLPFQVRQGSCFCFCCSCCYLFLFFNIRRIR